MREIAEFLKFLYGFIGLRIFLWASLAICTVVFEGIGVSLFLPLLEGQEIDHDFSRHLADAFSALSIDYTFTVLLLAMVGFFLLRAGFHILQDLYIKKIISRLQIDIRRDGVGGFLSSDYQYTLRMGTGYINNAITIEYPRTVAAFEQSVTVVVALCFSLMYCVLPFLINHMMTAVVMVVGLPAYFLFVKINRLTRSYSLVHTENNTRLQSHLIQALNNYKYLKATFSFEGIFARISAACQKLGEIFFKQSILQTITSSSIEPVIILIVAGLMYYQVEVIGGELLEVVFLLFLIRRGLQYALSVQQHYRKFAGLTGSINVYKQLSHGFQIHREDLNQDAQPPDFSKTIRFNDVSFCYGDGPLVLDHLDFEIAPNSTVAFVGGSGAGKSTLVTLLTGILRPTDGSVSLGECSYEGIDQERLRKGIGYVTQESVIFSDTIHNNVTLWGERASEDRVRWAASRAHIEDFIAGLPDGYQALMGDNGINISGGQRQRICIARELYKDVKLMIFDEATSSLDSHTEVEIQRNIDELRGEKTIVLIAHRLSTVQRSDVIFVLKDGKIVEQGTYDSLYRGNGEFRRMADQQMVHA